MSEQPTYWKHKDGAVYRVDENNGFFASRAIDLASSREVGIITHSKDFANLPLPDIGEKWQGEGCSFTIKDIVYDDPHESQPYIVAPSGKTFTMDYFMLNYFMLNYRKVEDVPKDEPTRVNEWGETVPISAGFARGETITQIVAEEPSPPAKSFTIAELEAEAKELTEEIIRLEYRQNIISNAIYALKALQLEREPK